MRGCSKENPLLNRDYRNISFAFNDAKVECTLVVLWTGERSEYQAQRVPGLSDPVKRFRGSGKKGAVKRLLRDRRADR